jgi:hypothetical protein
MKLTPEEIEYIIDTLSNECEMWEAGWYYVEYEMSDKAYEIANQILNKLKGDK